MTAEIRQRPCPDCGSPTKPIVYGLPGPELERQAQRGNVVLGGCCLSPLSPSHFCPACQKELKGPELDADDPGAFSFGHARAEEGRHAI